MLSGTSFKPQQLDEFLPDYDINFGKRRSSAWDSDAPDL